MLVANIFSFSHNILYLFTHKIISFCPAFNSSSENEFNLDKSKISLCGRGLNACVRDGLYEVVSI